MLFLRSFVVFVRSWTLHALSCSRSVWEYKARVLRSSDPNLYVCLQNKTNVTSALRWRQTEKDPDTLCRKVKTSAHRRILILSKGNSLAAAPSPAKSTWVLIIDSFVTWFNYWQPTTLNSTRPGRAETRPFLNIDLNISLDLCVGCVS